MKPFLQDADFTACIEWIGYRGRDGYGRINRKRWPQPQLAHRFIWEECFGPIPADAQIDHLCENPACINPEHLALRLSDRAHKQAHASRRTHCRRGHAYAEHGRFHAGTKARYCRACERENERRRRAA